MSKKSKRVAKDLSKPYPNQKRVVPPPQRSITRKVSNGFGIEEMRQLVHLKVGDAMAEDAKQFTIDVLNAQEKKP